MIRENIYKLNDFQIDQQIEACIGNKQKYFGYNIVQLFYSV